MHIPIPRNNNTNFYKMPEIDCFNLALAPLGVAFIIIRYFISPLVCWISLACFCFRHRRYQTGTRSGRYIVFSLPFHLVPSALPRALALKKNQKIIYIYYINNLMFLFILGVGIYIQIYYYRHKYKVFDYVHINSFILYQAICSKIYYIILFFLFWSEI